MGTTNILDLNNRVTSLEKAGLTATDVAYDNTDSGLTATNVQGAVDAVALKIAKTKIVNTIGIGQSVTIEGTDSDLIRMIILKRGSASVVAVALVDYWDTSATTVFGQIPSTVHITKEALSGTITISRDAGGSGAGIAYMVI